MDFILDKLLLIFILSNVGLGTEFNVPRHDLLILNDGQEIKCQVENATGDIIKVSTSDSERTVIRQLHTSAARDIVEAGVFKTTRYTGKLSYFCPEYLEIETYSGIVRVDKAKVRKIIISQESSYNDL